ncbi:hypothetical protein AV521_39810 [Streptomyces sp. IMTB 2501]|uniref:hypothetical protein n=1 Tax=Streptomyces sp. IMTB 2501 TaxID=1776340 RepID=UPI00096D36DB|nr:hypothetical protein [Streptomyces sp. IMTB 2501]OLZ63175.1 hypothetical protein AV521_39810 [Streptomyces sp. IMTB 2501]
MGRFAEAVRERVREARAALAAALQTEDAYEVAVAQDELDDALRVARRHGIDVDGDAAPEAGKG